MALNIRRIPDSLAFALVSASNQRMVDSVAALFHKDQTSTQAGDYQSPAVTRVSVTAPSATNTATEVALVNDLKAKLNRHLPDLIAHKTTASAAITTADATDGPTAITLGNAIRTAIIAHYTAATVHYSNDTANTITSAAATDGTTLNTLLNELKTSTNAHMASAPAGVYINIVGA